MKERCEAYRSALLLLVSFALLILSTSSALAQTASTGAMTGIVTDPSGAVISGATVTATNLATGQARTETTDASGAYKFSLMPPGAYSVKFSVQGFKTAEVPSVTVNVTETPVLNQKLEIGAQTQEVTVEGTAVTVQTENATEGTVVGSQEVNSLPLSSRNYTQILDLAPGVVANVASASAFGNGTQDVNVNGMGSDQNNYQMDGASITNYASGGAAQSGNYAGIGIPNPDSIQEFKIQTSQYDAAFGRNPGASVNVVTKGGSNQFHGDAWEFFRNNFLDANEYFERISEQTFGQPNKPQTLRQNQYGGTLGGPIKKDKLFFFGSYQGTRQVNGIVPQGYAAGVYLYPFTNPAFGDRADHPGQTYAQYLGQTFCSGGTLSAQTGGRYGGSSFLGPSPLCDGSNINPVAVSILQAPGPKGGFNKGYFVPSSPSGCFKPGQLCIANLEDPGIANEDQFVASTDFVISNKNTLSERYFISHDPQKVSFICLFPCDPGSPENETFTTHEGTLKLTSILTNNFVNEARFSFQRNLTNNSEGWKLTAPSVGMIPLVSNGSPTVPAGAVPDVLQLPAIQILGITGDGTFAFAGNPFSTTYNVTNVFQGADQISWNHGKHTIRTGFEAERLQWNDYQPAGGKGSLLFASLSDFLVGQNFNILGAIFATRGVPTGTNNAFRVNSFSSYIQDDIKLNTRLTVNVGVRWEYDGLPEDIRGELENVWPSLINTVNTGSFFLNNPQGTLAGFVAPANYNPVPFGLTAPNGATGVFVNTRKVVSRTDFFRH
jgi:hypothetical protein